MNRKKVVRVELVLLAVVTLLLAYRVLEGPPEPQGAVVMSDMDVERLHRQAFAIGHPTRLTIAAVGSFASAQKGEGALAAYGWVFDRVERKVVWKMDASKLTRERKSLASIRDTLLLNAGTYDVYFTSYGNRNGSRFGISLLDRILGDESAWRSDDDRWKMIVRRAPGDEGEIKRLREQNDAELAPQHPNLLWTTAPMRGRKQAEFIFQISEPAELSIYALGEIDRRQMDYGWIEDVVSGERIWEMTLENTTHAGGWSVNRIFDDTLSVEKGIYRASYRTDARQSWGDWVGNPPYDPAGWGMTLAASPASAVSPFDPLTTRRPIVELIRVRDSERRQAQFKINAPVQLGVYAVGELGRGSRYDWAWLRNNDSQEMVWEMTYDRTRQTGDDDSNREELAFFELQPGTYTLGYESDDSHSFDSWLHGEPEHPERWGVTLFPVAERIDSSVVEVLDVQSTSLSEAPPAPDHPEAPEHPVDLPPIPGSVMVTLSSVGNEERVKSAFTLREESRLHVRAVGEITISGRYDYAWIEKVDSGEIVWEMSWQNTQPAGGADKNRLYDGLVTLGPGQYIVHYRTDFSHAYGDFGDEAPTDPQAWGVRISKL